MQYIKQENPKIHAKQFWFNAISFYSVAQWVAHLTHTWWMPVSCAFEHHQRPPVVSLRKKLYPCCIVLVGSRNGFERDFTIKLRALWKIDLNVK